MDDTYDSNVMMEIYQELFADQENESGDAQMLRCAACMVLKCQLSSIHHIGISRVCDELCIAALVC